MFIEIYPFLLGFPVCWHIIVHKIILWFFVSMWYWLSLLLFHFLFYLFISFFLDEPGYVYIDVVYVFKNPHNCSLSMAIAALTLVWSYAMRKRGQSGYSVWVRAWAGEVLALVKIPDHSQYAAPWTSNGCPCPVWILCWVWPGSVPYNCTLSSATAGFALVWSCTMGQARTW